MMKKWIGTGWKMNHLMRDALDYAEELKQFCEQENPDINIFICVPFTVLYAVCDKLKDTPIQVASQNVHWMERGAATGEISPLMVKDTGTTLVEIGHSERRAMFGETDATVNAKVKAILQYGMRPLVCIGETADDKNMGVAIEKLAYQVKIAFKDVSADQANQLLVAYEPVWAIGESGSPASPEYASQVHTEIKQILCSLFGEQTGAAIPVLYGGSVNPQNALSLIGMPNIDGLFIGRAAWQAEGFTGIIKMVEAYLAKQ
jgi:triosephosphate isomerase